MNQSVFNGMSQLGDGFKDLMIFTPILGEIIQIDLRIFFKWVGSTTNQLHSGNLNIAGLEFSKHEFLSMYAY